MIGGGQRFTRSQARALAQSDFRYIVAPDGGVRGNVAILRLRTTRRPSN